LTSDLGIGNHPRYNSLVMYYLSTAHFCCVFSFQTALILRPAFDFWYARTVISYDLRIVLPYHT